MESTNGHRKLRYVVVGAGHIAQVAVLPAFEHASENSALVGIVSGDPGKRRELCAKYRVAFSGDYEELERVLADSHAGAAYIALPNTMHRSMTERCAAAGVHVLCEKPMAMTTDDCAAMVLACADREVKLMIAYRLHFEEANLRAVEIAKSGRLGELRYMSSVFSQVVRQGDIRTRAETGGGALYDMGIYCVNAARYLFRAEPLEVTAFRAEGHDVDETTSAILRFPGERLAQFTSSLSSAHASEYRIVGTRGDLRVEPAFGYATELVHHLRIDGKTEEKRFQKRDQFAPELVAFSRCVLTGRDPEPDGEEGLADVRVLEAIVESARTGKTVKLPTFQRRARPDMRQEMEMPPVEPEPEPVHAPSPGR